MAFDSLAVPAMLDECERLFSSAKILLNDHYSRLRIDIIEANECLRAWYGPPVCRTFDDESVGILEGEAPAQEDENIQDISDTDEEAEDEPQILDLEGERKAAGAASGEQDTGAGADEESEKYYI